MWFAVVWCVVVWCAVVWFALVWYGAVCCGLVWFLCGVLCCNVVCCSPLLFVGSRVVIYFRHYWLLVSVEGVRVVFLFNHVIPFLSTSEQRRLDIVDLTWGAKRSKRVKRINRTERLGVVRCCSLDCVLSIISSVVACWHSEECVGVVFLFPFISYVSLNEGKVTT